jgi:hypothetical protein
VKRLMLLGIVAVALASCIPAIPHPRVSRELAVPEPPDVAYVRALKATMAVGGLIHQQDPQLHLIHAQVQGAVNLNVLITPQGTGSLVAVTHQVAPTHIVYGPVTLADDFLTTYQQQR